MVVHHLVHKAGTYQNRLIIMMSALFTRRLDPNERTGVGAVLPACDRLIAHYPEDNVQRTLQSPQGGVPVLPALCTTWQPWLGVLSVPERLSRCVAESRP
jgi:hypothetical protein